MDEEEHLSFNKVIVFGDKEAGKTTLIKFYGSGRFLEVDSTEDYKFL